MNSTDEAIPMQGRPAKKTGEAGRFAMPPR